MLCDKFHRLATSSVFWRINRVDGRSTGTALFVEDCDPLNKFKSGTPLEARPKQFEEHQSSGTGPIRWLRTLAAEKFARSADVVEAAAAWLTARVDLSLLEI
jgi:hypothetical protein